MRSAFGTVVLALTGHATYLGSEKVAIIGGGAAGSTAAWFLSGGGFTDITLYEKQEKVGGLAETRMIGGLPYDLATMWIPESTIMGPGIHPELKKMIDYTGMELKLAERFEEVDITGVKPVSVVEFPMAFLGLFQNTTALIADMIGGYIETEKLFKCKLEGKSCIECGVCVDYAETVTTWATRKQLPAYGTFLEFITDGLGAGPAKNQWAGWVLDYIGFWWMPAEVHRILRKVGVTPSSLPANTPDSLRYLFEHDNGSGVEHWWHFKDGYQTFFINLTKKLADQNKLTLNLGTEVTALKPGAVKKWALTINGSDIEYDVVFLTAAPVDAARLLQAGKHKDLINMAAVPPQWPPKDIMIGSIANYTSSGFPTETGFWVFPLGSKAQEYPMFPSFWQKRHPANYMLAGMGIPPTGVSPEMSFEIVKNFTKHEMPFQFVNLTETYRVVFPSFPRTPQHWESWVTEWPTEQGKGELYFLGEAIGGSGVPGITEYMSRLRAAKLSINTATTAQPNATTAQPKQAASSCPSQAPVFVVFAISLMALAL